MSIWGLYKNLAYEIFYWLAYTKICTNENYPLYGSYRQTQNSNLWFNLILLIWLSANREFNGLFLALVLLILICYSSLEISKLLYM